MDALEHALTLRSSGYSVIPIREGEKRPLIKWVEYQERIASEEEVTRWFTRDPDANLAVVTGRISQLIVVDIDPRNGGEPIIDGTHLGHATTATGGGGWHYFLSYVPALAETKPGLYPGIDIKSDGGYVLTPPSRTDAPYRYCRIHDGVERREQSEGGQANAGAGTVGDQPSVGGSVLGSSADRHTSVLTVPERLPWDERVLNSILSRMGGCRQEQPNGASGSQSKAVNQGAICSPSAGRLITRGQGGITLPTIAEGGRNNFAAKFYGTLLYRGVVPSSARSILQLWNSGLPVPLPQGELDLVISSIDASHKRKKEREGKT